MMYRSFRQRLKRNQFLGLNLCNACILLRYMSSLLNMTNPFCNIHAKKMNKASIAYLLHHPWLGISPLVQIVETEP